MVCNVNVSNGNGGVGVVVVGGCFSVAFMLKLKKKQHFAKTLWKYLPHMCFRWSSIIDFHKNSNKTLKPNQTKTKATIISVQFICLLLLKWQTKTHTHRHTKRKAWNWAEPSEMNKTKKNEIKWKKEKKVYCNWLVSFKNMSSFLFTTLYCKRNEWWNKNNEHTNKRTIIVIAFIII